MTRLAINPHQMLLKYSCSPSLLPFVCLPFLRTASNLCCHIVRFRSTILSYRNAGIHTGRASIWLVGQLTHYRKRKKFLLPQDQSLHHIIIPILHYNLFPMLVSWDTQTCTQRSVPISRWRRRVQETLLVKTAGTIHCSISIPSGSSNPI